MKAAQAGDQTAADTLLRRHYDQIYAICRRLAGNEQDALDAAQESMIVLVRRLDRFDGRAKFTTWMYRVVTNACLDELRRRQRRPVPMEPTEVATRSTERAVADSVADKVDVENALSQLPEEFRVPVVLCDQIGCSYEEIAEVLDVPVGTVRSRISRGRARLVELIDGNPTAPSERPTTRQP